MKFFTVYKKYALFLFAIITLTLYGGIVVSAIEPGQTLDPVGDALCAGPTDPACAINLYDGLDPNGVLYLDDNGQLATVSDFIKDESGFYVGSEVSPGVIGGLKIGELVIPDSFGIPALPGVGMEMISDEFHGLMGFLDVGGSGGFGILTQDQSTGIQTSLLMDNLGVDFAMFMDNGDTIGNVGTSPTGASLGWRESNNHYQLRLNNDGLQYIFGWNGNAPEDYYIFPNSVADAGQVLTDLNGNGTLSWETPTSLSGLTENNNTFLGIDAGLNNSGANANTFLGYQSGYSNTTGHNNTAIGLSSLSANTTGHNNTAIGLSSLSANTTGHNNTAIGLSSLSANTTGFYNTANGALSLLSNTTGSYNTATGFKSLFLNTTGEYNTGHGYQTIAFNQTGSFNTAFGYAALEVVTNSRNTANGFQSLSQTVSGSDNTALGYRSGYTNLAGTNNTLIGSFADVTTSSTSNAIALGYGAIAAANEFALSDGITKWKFSGESYTLPTAYPGASGYVLASTDAGVMSWTAPFGDDCGSGYCFTVSGQNMFAGPGSESFSPTGQENLFIGHSSGGATTTGAANVFVGFSAGNLNETGLGNVFVGDRAGLSNVDGSGNSFYGYYAGANQLSSYQVGIGYEALKGSVIPADNTGTSNIAIGYQSGYSNTSGAQNLFSGRVAGYSNTSGANNVFLGMQSGFSNTEGSGNIFLGSASGFSNTTGSNNIIIGFNIDVPNVDPATSGQLSIGNIIYGTGIDASGTTIDTDALIGIGTNTPSFRLDVRRADNGAVAYFADDDNSCTITPDTGVNCTSDERLKTNIQGIHGALEQINNIDAVTYTLKADKDNSNHIGFIAQNIESIFPELVITDARGYLAVNYAGMTPILTKAIQELDLKLTGIQTLSDQTFLSRMRNWFADAGNGISSFIAGTIRAKDQLCVGNTCVTEDQLQQLLQNQNISTVYYSSGDDTDDIDDTNDTDEENISEDEMVSEEGNESEVVDEGGENISDESVVNEEQQGDAEEESEESTQESLDENTSEESSESDNNDSGEVSPTE